MSLRLQTTSLVPPEQPAADSGVETVAVESMPEYTVSTDKPTAIETKLLYNTELCVRAA